MPDSPAGRSPGRCPVGPLASRVRASQLPTPARGGWRDLPPDQPGRAFSGEISFPHADLVPELGAPTLARACPRASIASNKVVRPSFWRFTRTNRLWWSSRGRNHRSTPCGAKAAASRTMPTASSASGPTARALPHGTLRRPDPRAASDVASADALDRPWTLTADPGQGVGLAPPVKVELDKLVSWRKCRTAEFVGIATYGSRSSCPRVPPRRPGPAAGTGRGLRIGGPVRERPRRGTSWFAPHGLDLTGPSSPAGTAAHRRAQRAQEPFGAGRLCASLGPAGPSSDPARGASLPAGLDSMTASLSKSARLAVLPEDWASTLSKAVLFTVPGPHFDGRHALSFGGEVGRNPSASQTGKSAART